MSSTRFTLRGVWAELLRTGREEGLRGLFRGNAAQVARIYPYSGIQLASFDVYSGLLLGRHRDVAAAAEPPRDGSAATQLHRHRLSNLERIIAGAAAGGTSVVATYPLDLIRARLAVQRDSGRGAPAPPLADNTMATQRQSGLPVAPGTDPPPHRPPPTAASLPQPPRRVGGLAAVLGAVKAGSGSGGLLASLYRGMSPTLLGIVPYAGVSFATFEGLKAYLADSNGGAEPGAALRLACGGAAGLAGQALTYPLDIVRRRMQTEGFTPLHAHAAASPTVSAGGSSGGSFPVQRHTMRATLAHIRATEGWRGLWKGLSLNFVKGPVSVGASFTIYDLLKKEWRLERHDY